MSTLQGKWVWITGASSGIGAALAVECRARGASLVLSSRRAGELQRLAERLAQPASRASRGPAGSPAPSSEIVVVPMDVADPDQVTAAVERVASDAGPVDIMIHAAGVSQRATGMQTEVNVLRRILETNFFGVVALTRALLASREGSAGIHIVVITSAFGKFGAPGRTAYAASKHALHGYFDSLRTELSPGSARITLIVPGAIATNIAANALRGDGTKHQLADEMIANGMSADRCARRIVRAIELNRAEMKVATDLRLWVAYLLKQFAPRLLTRILRRARIS